MATVSRPPLWRPRAARDDDLRGNAYPARDRCPSAHFGLGTVVALSRRTRAVALNMPFDVQVFAGAAEAFRTNVKAFPFVLRRPARW